MLGPASPSHHSYTDDLFPTVPFFFTQIYRGNSLTWCVGTSRVRCPWRPGTGLVSHWVSNLESLDMGAIVYKLPLYHSDTLNLCGMTLSFRKDEKGRTELGRQAPDIMPSYTSLSPISQISPRLFSHMSSHFVSILGSLAETV